MKSKLKDAVLEMQNSLWCWYCDKDWLCFEDREYGQAILSILSLLEIKDKYSKLIKDIEHDLETVCVSNEKLGRYQWNDSIVVSATLELHRRLNPLNGKLCKYMENGERVDDYIDRLSRIVWQDEAIQHEICYMDCVYPMDFEARLKEEVYLYESYQLKKKERSKQELGDKNELTGNEAAKYLGIRREKISEWTDSGDLRLNERGRYQRDNLDKMKRLVDATSVVVDNLAADDSPVGPTVNKKPRKPRTKPETKKLSMEDQLKELRKKRGGAP